MTDTVTTALITASSSVLVAITALLLNYRGFTSLENRVNNLENRIDRRLDAIQADLKEFYRMMADLDKRVTRLEDKK